jgi:hypothetical protein
VEFWDNVTKLPATSANAVEDAVLAVPVVVPPAMLLIVVSTVVPPPPPPDVPMIVIWGLVEFWDRVIFDPATSANAELDAVFAVPDVDPPAVRAATDTRVDAVFEIVIVERLDEKLMPAPATRLTLDADPFREKFVAALDTEMVIDDRLDDIPIPAPAIRDALELDPFKLKLVATGTVGPTMVTACNDCDKVMFDPPTNVTAPLVMDDVAPAVFPLVPMTMALCTVPELAAEMVMDDAPVVSVILLPPTRVTDPVEPFREKLESVPSDPDKDDRKLLTDPA